MWFGIEMFGSFFYKIGIETRNRKESETIIRIRIDNQIPSPTDSLELPALRE